MSSREKLQDQGENFFAIRSFECESELGLQDAVARSQIEAGAGKNCREKPFAVSEHLQSCREAARRRACGEKFCNELHERWGEDMQTEEAEVVTGAQAGDDELLLGFCGSGFFDYGIDQIERLQVGAGNRGTADGTEVRQQRFTSGLDCGNTTGLPCEGIDHGCGESPGRALVGHVEMISDEVKERSVADEVSGLVECLHVSERFRLFDKRNAVAALIDDMMEAV